MSRGQAPAKAITMTKIQREFLKELASKHTTPQQVAKRSRILLFANQGKSNSEVKRMMGVSLNTVKQWRKRWESNQSSLTKYEQEVESGQASQLAYHRAMIGVLKDKPRPGTPKTISLSQEKQIVALACEKPIDFGIEMTTWTHEMLAHVAITKGIIESISSRQVGRILKNKPHPTS